jgi:glycosyltransferase involved in cell wall biosynthesis
MHAELPPGRFIRFDFRGVPTPGAAQLAAKALFPVVIWLEGCDLLFGSNYFLPRPMSAVAKRRVVTVHDLTFRRYPHLLQQETLANLDREMSRELFRTDAVISVSEATSRDLHTYYSIDETKSFTIHSGLAPLPVSRIDGFLPKRYLLFVSTIEPRKDLDTLLGAFEMLKQSGEFDGDLVIVGRIGWKSGKTVERMKRSRWSRCIHHLDYVSRASLSAIYERAEVFVFPSLYEGFGFPILEAMSSGAPVIAARSSSLPEIGGDAALYFQPGNADELAGRIAELMRDPALRSDLIVRGRARVAEFDWRKAAGETAAVFHRVAEQ